MPSDERHASKHHNDFPSGTDTVEPAVSCGMLSDQKLPGTESFLLHVWLVFVCIFLPVLFVSWMGSFYSELDFYELLFWVTEDCKWITLSGSLIFMAVNNVWWHIRLLYNVRKYNKQLQIKRKLKISKIWMRLPHNTTTF